MTKARELSQSAIVESGSNANGEYVKWDDGTMMCWFLSSSLTTTNVLADAIFRSNAETFTFPEPFTSKPKVSDASESTAWGFWSSFYNTSAIDVNMTGFGYRNDAGGYFGYVAIGRWK